MLVWVLKNLTLRHSARLCKRSFLIKVQAISRTCFLDCCSAAVDCLDWTCLFIPIFLRSLRHFEHFIRMCIILRISSRTNSKTDLFVSNFDYFLLSGGLVFNIRILHYIPFIIRRPRLLLLIALATNQVRPMHHLMFVTCIQLDLLHLQKIEVLRILVILHPRIVLP